MPKRITETDRKIAKRLTELRIKRGLSMSELGRRIGVTMQQIQKYEGCKNRIPTNRLVKIADILEVHPSYFFNGL